MYYKTVIPSPVGAITLAGDEENLIGLWLAGQKYHGDTLSITMQENSSLPIFDTVKEWLNQYFQGEKPAIDRLPLKPIGGAFRQAVWGILREIPYGETTTYGSVAEKTAAKLGKNRMSSRAVGGAVGHNPISIIIPCHRVIGADGSLTGYAGGIAVKKKLLELEGAGMLS
jgi:methylated-DNA-[protein]-cysteine S-methyltransferase